MWKPVDGHRQKGILTDLQILQKKQTSMICWFCKGDIQGKDRKEWKEEERVQTSNSRRVAGWHTSFSRYLKGCINLLFPNICIVLCVWGKLITIKRLKSEDSQWKFFSLALIHRFMDLMRDIKYFHCFFFSPLSMLFNLPLRPPFPSSLLHILRSMKEGFFHFPNFLT